MIFYHILPKVRFFYLGKKKGRQKIYIRHVSSYFFIFLHVSSCFSIFFVCFSCFFMFYLGALVLPLLRGPLPVPPGRSPFPSIFVYPGRSTRASFGGSFCRAARPSAEGGSSGPGRHYQRSYKVSRLGGPGAS